ncbi:MAG: hypothetical protein Q4A43_04435 [Coriobacteriia bacterium]|nr:hypothetical protein [Coriobacteriia bacterium]
MLKAFPKSIAALFVAAALMLGLPALSFADEDTSGGGKRLSDFTDVDWNTVELSFGSGEFTFDEVEDLCQISPSYIACESKLYVGGDKKDFLSYEYSNFFVGDSFFKTQDYSSKVESVTESGIYYIRVTASYDCSGETIPVDRYVPVKINIVEANPYDLSKYSLYLGDEEDESEMDFWVGDKELESTSSAKDVTDFSFSYYGFDGRHTLPKDAYTVDSTWYKRVETDDYEYSYEAIQPAPSKSGYYAFKIVGAGQYTGENYVYFFVDDINDANNFFVSSDCLLSLDKYETVSDLRDSLEVSVRGKAEDDTRVLALGTDYEILKWGIQDEREGEGDDGDPTWTEIETTTQLKDETYGVLVKPLDPYYGDSQWLDIRVMDLKSLESYNFEIDNDNPNGLVIGIDDLDIGSLKVKGECYRDEDISLTQGTDFELGDAWYKEVYLESEEESEFIGYEAIEGQPKEKGCYRISIIGKGDFEGQTDYLYVYVNDATKLSNYVLSYKRYLSTDSSLALGDLELSLSGYFSNHERTLTLGTDYTVRWGSYDSNGKFQMLDEGKYPEVSEETTDYCLKVIGLGDFEGQELDPEQVTIHKGECTHSDTRPYYEEATATCTEAGYKGGTICCYCGKIIEEPTVVKALGHKLKEYKSTAKNATCTEDGKYADKYCIRCDYEEEGAVIPKGSGTHSYVTDEPDTKPAKDATCTEGGYVPAQVCSACGDKKAGYTTEALGHDYKEVAGTAVAATCNKAGKEASKQCTRCSEVVQGKEIPATGKHTAKVTKAGVAATYTSTGLTEEKVCADCGAVLQKQGVIAKLSAKAQSVSVKTATKTVKKAKVKKKAQVVSGAVKVSGAKGKVTYAKAGGSGKLSVNASNGKITVKKKTKKGTYSVKVKVNVAASASGEFKAYTKTVTVKVKVK